MVLQNDYLRENLMSVILPSLLASSALEPNKVRLFDAKDGDLKDRTEKGLAALREGDVRGEKVVIKIGP